MPRSNKSAKEVKKVLPNVTAVYQKFLESVSSGEREVYENDFVAAIKGFRKYIDSLTDAQVKELLISPAEPVEELPVEE